MRCIIKVYVLGGGGCRVGGGVWCEFWLGVFMVMGGGRMEGEWGGL